MSKLTNWVLLCGLATVGAGQSIIFSVLPPLGREIGIPDYQIALIFTLAAIAFMLSAPFWGKKSDQWGRKKLIVFGFLGYAISTALFGVFGDLGRVGIISAFSAFLFMTGARLCYALLSSGVFPSVQAAMAESAPDEKRASVMASIQAAFGLGMIGGPAIASLLVIVSITLPLYVSGALAAIAALLVIRLVPNSKPAIREGEQVKLLITDRRIFLMLITGFVYFITLSGLLQLAAFRYQDLFFLEPSAAAAQSSIGFVFSALATIATQVMIMGKLKLPASRMVQFGLALGAIAFAFMTQTQELWHVHGMFALFGISIGLMTTGFNTSVTLAVSQQELGAVSGLAASAQAGGYIVGPLLAASLYQLQTESPFWLFAVVLAILTLIVTAAGARSSKPIQTS
ncbi:MFS transporter [Vibrio sp. LaRot3]|uniref:MFS transporter n=1 Tax=Vibrio sp. LaRot3 TaxID=2998829 RepID=UPI0022CDF762|nr:MFS transporter [Vibrio sp. LaRot3]MDA0149568.1 MFS transporter [Vibrio sp. LaRot3]